MLVSDFDYHLPEELIAQEPVEPRDSSRLLVLHRNTGHTEHRIFSDLVDYLTPQDLLVMNDTRVLPARLFGKRIDTGAIIEVFLLHAVRDRVWECMVRPGKKAQIGTCLDFGDGLMKGKVLGKTASGERRIEFSVDGNFRSVLERLGEVPLPPYIKHYVRDREQYQTVYSREEGSVAAPTAGLHFTSNLLQELNKRQIETAFVTLHVGLGTFRPVKTDEVEDHIMHNEYYHIPPETAQAVERTRQRGGRVIAVGTTSARTLESAATAEGRITPGSGGTGIFIYPGYQFKVVDALVTNFHLPKSTLLMLVSALAGREKVIQTYHCAIRERYRFFSFGDAMLIL